MSENGLEASTGTSTSRLLPDPLFRPAGRVLVHGVHGAQRHRHGSQSALAQAVGATVRATGGLRLDIEEGQEIFENSINLLLPLVIFQQSYRLVATKH